MFKISSIKIKNNSSFVCTWSVW